MLWKCESDVVPVIDWQPLEVREDASYIEQPVRILDRKEQVLRTKVIPLVKVQWSHHSANEASWEREAEIRESYPHLFYD